MPSGAKKRKAAKKKAQKQVHSTTDDGSHLQGVDEAKSYDERESEGERDSSEERAVSKHEEGGKSATGFSEAAKSKEVKYDDMIGSAVSNVKNGLHKGSSSSSSSNSSSSDDEEVAVEEEKVVAAEEGLLEEQAPEMSTENPVVSEVFDSVEESIPVEESVKQVVLDNNGSKSAAVDNSMISHVSETGMKQNLDEALPSADGKDKFSPGATDYLQEKIETKVVQVAEVSEFTDTTRDGEGLLPQSSGVMSADVYCEDNHVKESEVQKYTEEQPLVSSSPLLVRRTSLVNCCGLFEVFSGGASR